MIEEGIINVYKERGMTSHDVVSKIRRLAGTRRVGHTGTLDPEAEGVLPICIGRATRIIEYLDCDLKTYECTMVLGKRTDTEDVWGEVIQESTEADVNRITEEAVRAVSRDLQGVVTQVPPKYSAIRVNGKRLYQYARSGEEVEIPSREVYIESLEFTDFNLGKGYESSISFTLRCGKGTYVRSICDEIGERLGTFAAMSKLTRTETGTFNIRCAHKLSELQDMEEAELQEFVLPTEMALTHFGRVDVDSFCARRLKNGLDVWLKNVKLVESHESLKQVIDISEREEYKRKYLAFENETFIGIVRKEVENSSIRPEKMFL